MAKPTLSKLTITLPKSVNEALHKAAEDRDVSPSKLAARAIEKFIGELIPLDDFRTYQTGGIVSRGSEATVGAGETIVQRQAAHEEANEVPEAERPF